ncbi:class I SAM-dependent methyltransferase [Caulobacter mirabilis]|uniref:SAM-dependent methyltransferase n=1 Tax=Caulobacter mirabilis TaxID=69666 RepID=A0A2D2B245_9CAUL|nr:class I SAM-dependent methyltransferase [Caulobacter mirabilis]ATQ44345.1 SAM-dependent methyltransferase [Caulobacter mirabilis]
MERVVYDRIRVLEQDHWWFAGRRRILTGLIGDLPLPSDARILEVGCGAGGNIGMLRRFGSVRAMEPDAPSRAYASERHDMTVDDGRLPDGTPYAPASFDAVCAFDVVEHVDDDAATVSALARLLDRSGYLVVTVPAYGWMWSAHDEAHHHKRRYGRAQMEQLFRDAGLEIVRASYFNSLLLPLAAGVRLAKRLVGIRSEDDAMPPASVNRLLEQIFSSEAGWLRRRSLPFGLSIIVIGRRSA